MAESAQVNPAYVTYSTVKNMVDNFRELGSIPSHIDGSVLGNISGSTRAALMPSLRFLGLINVNNEPTEDLQKIIKGTEEERKNVYRKILNKLYPKAVAQLKNGTHISLVKNFDYEGKGDTIKKAISFFILAARDAGFEISSFILNKSRVRKPRSNGKSEKKQRKETPSFTSAEKSQESENEGEAYDKETMIKFPITIGLNPDDENKPLVWHVVISKKHTDEQINKFLELIRMSLGAK